MMDRTRGRCAVVIATAARCCGAVAIATAARCGLAGTPVNADADATRARRMQTLFAINIMEGRTAGVRQHFDEGRRITACVLQ